jgi:iron complex outermembrane receptor protein/hemoglobin/transferrin/lactoferrin receptor protein
MNHKYSLFSIVLISLHVPIALSQNIEVITVTASPLETKINQANAAISILSGKEKARKQSLSLGATLAGEVGVDNISTGDQAGKPVIRGLSGNRVRILSDGVAQDHQQFGIRHIPNIDPFLAHRIEIVRGPMSVLYGADAIGGVINLVPRKISFENDKVSLLKVTSRFSTNNNANMLGLETAGSTAKWGWVGAMSHNSGDNFETPNTATFPNATSRTAPKFSGEIPFTNYRVVNGTVGLGYQGENIDMTTRYTYWNNKQNYLQPDATATGQELVNINLTNEATWWLNDDWKLSSLLSWQNNSREAGTGFSFENLSEQNKDLAIELDRYSARIGLVHPMIGDWQGELGIDLVSKDQKTTIGDLVPNAKLDGSAIYLFEQAQLDDVFMQFGARYDVIELTPSSSENAFVEDIEQRRWNALTGSVGLTWQWKEGYLLAMNVARGFRAPSIFELYANGVHGGIAAVQQGNTALLEETAINKDVGIRIIQETIDFTITYYHNNINDYIYQENTQTFSPVANLPIYQITQADATLEGVEIALNWEPIEHSKIEINYATVNGRLESASENLPLLPADNINAHFHYTFGDVSLINALEFSVGVKHSWAKESAGPYEPFSQFDSTPFGTASTDAYNLWDASIFGEVQVQNYQVDLGLSVSNLFDSEYRDFLDTYKGYALGMGRNITLTLSVSI